MTPQVTASVVRSVALEALTACSRGSAAGPPDPPYGIPVRGSSAGAGRSRGGVRLLLLFRAVGRCSLHLHAWRGCWLARLQDGGREQASDAQCLDTEHGDVHVVDQ